MTVSVKLSERTRKLLRLIAAINDESIAEVAEKLAEKEWGRVQEECDVKHLERGPGLRTDVVRGE